VAIELGDDGRGRVLLVEDSPELLATMVEVLVGAGFRVDTAANGNEALTRLQTRPPDVVVADVEMPGMNGYELCRRLRAAGHAEIPFVFCSGLAETEARLQGFKAGGDDYIVKPASLDELVLKLSRQVERVRHLRSIAVAAAATLDAAGIAALEARVGRSDGDVPRLGRFEIREILGRGAMGIVFRAWDGKLERWVAIKTLGAAVGMGEFWDKALVRGLVAEAAMAARFNHRHVVTVYDVQDAVGAAYIVMELVQGVSLQDFLTKGARLRPEHAVNLMCAVVSALAAAHGIGLLHRDVKPGNVLLGRDGAIKLTDFGIASYVSSHISGAIFGTPGYLPPEAIRGEAVDGTGDLFALGALAYRCLTGRSPFPGRNPAEILANTLNSPPPPVRETGVDVPAELETIVAGLLEADPRRRIGDAARLTEELEVLSTRLGGRWAMPVPTLPRAGDESGDAASDVPRAQLVATMAAEPPPTL
jgi:serine/threonine-protein kinase